MPTRRQVLLTAIAASLAPRLALAKASQPATGVNFEVPAGACDCHTHIHGDLREFPMFPGRVYTPEPALPEEMAQLHKAHMHAGVRKQILVDNPVRLYGFTA